MARYWLLVALVTYLIPASTALVLACCPAPPSVRPVVNVPGAACSPGGKLASHYGNVSPLKASACPRSAANQFRRTSSTDTPLGASAPSHWPSR